MSKISLKDRYIENVQNYARQHYPLIKTMSVKIVSNAEKNLERGDDIYSEKVCFSEQVKNMNGRQKEFLSYRLCNQLVQDIFGSMTNKYSDINITSKYNSFYECEINFGIKDVSINNFVNDSLQVRQNELRQKQMKEAELRQKQMKEAELRQKQMKEAELRQNEFRERQVKEAELRQKQMKDSELRKNEPKQTEPKQTEPRQNSFLTKFWMYTKS